MVQLKQDDLVTVDGVLGRVQVRDQRHPRVVREAGGTALGPGRAGAAPRPLVLEEGQVVDVEGRKVVVEYRRQNRDEPIVLVPRVEGAEDEAR